MAEPGTTRKAPPMSTVQALAIASQFGVSLAVAVGVGLLVGQWLDGRLGTGLLFTLVGVFLGLAGAGMTTVTLYRNSLKKNALAWEQSESLSHGETDSQHQINEQDG